MWSKHPLALSEKNVKGDWKSWWTSLCDPLLVGRMRQKKTWMNTPHKREELITLKSIFGLEVTMGCLKTRQSSLTQYSAFNSCIFLVTEQKNMKKLAKKCDACLCIIRFIDANNLL